VPGAWFAWPLIIPAIVDGIKSSQANQELDQDYQKKAADNLVITPGSFHKTIVFVPKASFEPIFNIDLVEQETGEKKSVEVSVFR